MGSPDWSKIAFEKMPKWKQDEIIAQNKNTIEKLEQIQQEEDKFKCDVCGQVCKSKAGLVAHMRKHK